MQSTEGDVRQCDKKGMSRGAYLTVTPAHSQKHDHRKHVLKHRNKCA